MYSSGITQINWIYSSFGSAPYHASQVNTAIPILSQNPFIFWIRRTFIPHSSSWIAIFVRGLGGGGLLRNSFIPRLSYLSGLYAQYCMVEIKMNLQSWRIPLKRINSAEFIWILPQRRSVLKLSSEIKGTSWMASAPEISSAVPNYDSCILRYQFVRAMQILHIFEGLAVTTRASLFAVTSWTSVTACIYMVEVETRSPSLLLPL